MCNDIALLNYCIVSDLFINKEDTGKVELYNQKFIIYIKRVCPTLECPIQTHCVKL